jgi:hypothetical protein
MMNGNEVNLSRAIFNGMVFSALARVLALQRSETLQGRKKFMSANEGNL